MHGCVFSFKPLWYIWSGSLLWLRKSTTQTSLHPSKKKKSRFWPGSSTTPSPHHPLPISSPLWSLPLSSLADCCIVSLCSIVLAQCIQACWHMQSSTARHPNKSTHTHAQHPHPHTYTPWIHLFSCCINADVLSVTAELPGLLEISPSSASYCSQQALFSLKLLVVLSKGEFHMDIYYNKTLLWICIL